MQGLGSVGHSLVPLSLVVGHTAAILFARGEGAHAVGPCISTGRAAPIRVLHVDHGRSADQQHQSAQGESQSSYVVLRVTGEIEAGGRIGGRVPRPQAR
jgi:hypothetical protein